MTEAAATILVIDDDPTSLGVALKHLSAYDYAVLTARDGERGFRRALHVRPDLVLLDLGLPGIDGHEVCRRLKAHPVTKDIPVIFLTARATVDDKLRSFELDGVDYLTKPFAAAELVARVRMHLRQATQRQALEAHRQGLEAELVEARRQLSIALDRRLEDEEERDRLRTLVEAQRTHLQAQVQRWMDPDGAGGLGRRPDATERVHLALELLECARLQTIERQEPGLVQAMKLLAPLVDAELPASPPDEPDEDGSLDGLSEREREVFELLIKGRTNKQISTHLGVSTSTVSTYRSRVMEKLGAPNVAALVRLALMRGL
jgi:DNA-binding response OmpR family regulator/DNA-binding CsgD family transcriptional regulator